MKFGPQRGHFLYIFENFFVNFGLLILMLAFFLITGEWQLLMNYIVIPIIAVIGPITKVLEYLFTYYSISDDALFIDKGIIKKKKTEIPLSTITNVDFSQGLILQVAHAYSITVDTAASISAENKVKAKLTLKKEEAEKVKAMLLAHKYKAANAEMPNREGGDSLEESLPSAPAPLDEEIISITHATFKEILLMGLMEAKIIVIIQILSIAGVMITFGSRLIMNRAIDGDQFLIDYIFQLSGLAILVVVVLAVYAIGFLVGILRSMLKYYNFRITNRKDSIFIEYGLLTKKTHTLLKKRISGVQFQQPLLMRLFKCGVVHVFAVGYGDNPEEGDVTSILFPYLKTADLDGFISHHFPDLPEEGEIQMATKQSIRYFFIAPRFFAGLYVLAMGIILLFVPSTDSGPDAIIFSVAWIPASIILAAAIASILLEYKNSGLYSTSRCTFLSTDGFTKKQTLLYTDKIESLSGTGSVFKRRKGILTIQLGIWGSKLTSIHKVRNLEISALENLKSHLVY